MPRGGQKEDVHFHNLNGASKHDERPSEADAMPMFVWRLILCDTVLTEHRAKSALPFGFETGEGDEELTQADGIEYYTWDTCTKFVLALVLALSWAGRRAEEDAPTLQNSKNRIYHVSFVLLYVKWRCGGPRVTCTVHRPRSAPTCSHS